MVLYHRFENVGPVRTHDLVRNGQRLWVEESGNPEGIPVLFLHGGPGSGCKPQHRCFFDPERFRIFLHDQRGCGHSRDGTGLTQNTTQEILADVMYIQNILNVRSWILFGGSWGATLALLYAEAWPDRVAGMVLRGTFLARREDLDWFIGPLGVRRLYAEAWATIPELTSVKDCDEVIATLSAGVHSEDPATRWRMASAWELWGAIVTLNNPSRERLSFDDERADRVIQQSQIELHYARHQYFLRDNQILGDIGHVSGVPAVIIHGQKDLVCPCASAYLLHESMPRSTLRILEDSAHVPSDDAMIAALIQATEEIAEIGFKKK
jgi:proline iminopeptidase